MEPTEPSATPFAAIFACLIVLALAALAVHRGERAYREQAQALIRKRTKIACACLLIWGIFAVAISALEVATARLPFHERQGWGMLVGILGGIPATVALLVGLFHGLMAWRSAAVRILLLATAGFLALFFSDEVFYTTFLVGVRADVIGVGYGLLVVVVSVRALLRLRATPA